MAVHSPCDLDRFLQAQEDVYGDVVAELRVGKKTSHWMWFVFPQLRGLGRSTLAVHYGIGSPAEALAYLQHPVLGPRLVECTRLMLALPHKSALAILGSPDDLKFRSCMTLFGHVAPDMPVFQEALGRFFGGQADPVTAALLAADKPPESGGL